jgi:hypothetical protein
MERIEIIESRLDSLEDSLKMLEESLRNLIDAQDERDFLKIFFDVGGND